MSFAEKVRRRLKGASLTLNSYVLHRGLALLPVLVKRQRRLEKRIAKLEPLAAQEKATRDAIDRMLVKAHIGINDGVTCLGYDVVHRERDGRKYVCPERLRLAGVPEIDIQFATLEGKRSAFATVRPMKGAEVKGAEVAAA